MSEYDFKKIETNWQQYWKDQEIYKVSSDTSLPKYYVLDMFPYPSGAGLHVGHPLGYIASDIYSRYKRLTGFNVLHPMGYDAFGLPAEQYAIQTGQHPSVTTHQNIDRYREQLDKIGFSYDWSREVRTSQPEYYRWTQWIFLQLFNAWYNPKENKAEHIDTLIAIFASEGFNGDNHEILTGNIEHDIQPFSASEWNAWTEEVQLNVLMNFRLAYLSESYVNWCPELGTVLANDEVKEGVSERGGHPVERKLMMQWSMRINCYAERLLNDLNTIDWPEPLKESQRNWIGKSAGSSLKFKFIDHDGDIEVFTTRPDTVFGVSFVTLAPEHELVAKITTLEQKELVEKYIQFAKNRTERERMAEVKNITGQFTGAYVAHPFTGLAIPVWIGDYVLAGYGTGAVMAVPGHDGRDYAFAKHFELPIIEVVSGGDLSIESYDAKEGKLINSDFLNGLEVKAAISKAIEAIEKKGLGKGTINYRLRDAIFGRQRYWGEPIPIYYKNGIPYPLAEDQLPLILPEIDKYLPTETGEPPLARANDWFVTGTDGEKYPLETTTMPGWAGSSWYMFRYMDPSNSEAFASKEALNYWQQVDLYLGGSEHATGHLLYVRFWTKFLYDMNYLSVNEPAKKLINQGMIQGRSNFVYRVKDSNKYVSLGLKDQYHTMPIHVDVNLVKNDILDIEGLRNWRDDFKDAEFELEDGKYICGWEIAKMSKRWYNVVNPDDVCNDYGADTLRMFEMFLGPLEQSKPWNTQGIEGVHRFLKKLWALFYNRDGNYIVNHEAADKKELKVLHKTIKKATEDIEAFSFNTSVSAFMIAVNELTELGCHKQQVLESLLILISPYAPHVCEELYSKLGNTNSITKAVWPTFNAEYLVEDHFAYPISINGKTRTTIEMAMDTTAEAAEGLVMADNIVQKWLEGKTPKKIIFVKGRIVNVVV
jgi:leucyl-tRNA synthetase